MRGESPGIEASRYGGNLVWDGVLRVTGMGPSQKELKMPIIKIEPVEFATWAGEVAHVTGIDTSSVHPLVGLVQLGVQGDIKAAWGLKGEVLTHELRYNLSDESVDSKEFQGLKEATINLVPPSSRAALGYA